MRVKVSSPPFLRRCPFLLRVGGWLISFFYIVWGKPEYAQVLKMLGNGRLEAQCFDGEKRLAHIRGKLRKKVWINQGDIILISLRDFQDGKADVIQKYNADEARALKQQGELPESAKINETDTFGEDEGGEIEFQEGSDEEEESDDDDDLDDL